MTFTADEIKVLAAALENYALELEDRAHRESSEPSGDQDASARVVEVLNAQAEEARSLIERL